MLKGYILFYTAPKDRESNRHFRLVNCTPLYAQFPNRISKYYNINKNSQFHKENGY
jgi:hypothetical protein